MDFLNSIILQKIEEDTYKQAYNDAGNIGLILMVLVVLWYTWRMRQRPWKTIPIAAIGYLFAVNTNGLVIAISSGFAKANQVNLAVIFVYLPLLAWALAKVFRVSWNMVSELLSFSVMTFHMLGRSGCLFTGCCYGYPCEWGVYSEMTGEYVFPVVLVESLMVLVILIFLFIRTGKKHYVPDGKSMPWMLLLYGIGRFGTEFLRDNEKIWLGCSDIAFHALFMAVVGLGLLLHIRWQAIKASAKHFA